MTRIQRAVARLVERHKGLRAAARAIDVDPSYLLRLRDVPTSRPTAETLAKLGLERREGYVRKGNGT